MDGRFNWEKPGNRTAKVRVGGWKTGGFPDASNMSSLWIDSLQKVKKIERGIFRL